MTRLVIIRHGESVYNIERRYTGQTDVALTEKGVLQAEITGKYILENYRIDEIYSSDLIRAVNTAKPIADPLGLEIKTDARLREIYAGKWQGYYFSEVAEIFKEEYEYYKSHKTTARTPGGEGMQDVMKRMHEAVLEIAEANDGKTVLISTHNGPLMTLEVLVYGIPLNEIYSVANNSITELEYENGSFKAVKFGYNEHLNELVTIFKNNSEN